MDDFTGKGVRIPCFDSVEFEVSVRKLLRNGNNIRSLDIKN